MKKVIFDENQHRAFDSMVPWSLEEHMNIIKSKNTTEFEMLDKDYDINRRIMSRIPSN